MVTIVSGREKLTIPIHYPSPLATLKTIESQPVHVKTALLTFSVRFRASFNEPKRVLGELPQWLRKLHNLIHFQMIFDGNLKLNEL